MTEPGNQQDQTLSQIFWNDAYDGLEKDPDTAELVKYYVKTVTEVLVAKKASHTSAAGTSDISTALKDLAKRQMYMKKLIEEGQAKVCRASKITKAVG